MDWVPVNSVNNNMMFTVIALETAICIANCILENGEFRIIKVETDSVNLVDDFVDGNEKGKVNLRLNSAIHISIGS